MKYNDLVIQIEYWDIEFYTFFNKPDFLPKHKNLPALLKLVIKEIEEIQKLNRFHKFS